MQECKRFHSTLTWFRSVQRRLVLLFLIVLGLAPGGVMHAQVDTGAVVGNIADASGASIPDVTVTATEQNTGIKTKVVTGNDGNYTISPLKLGTYSISVEKEGFETAVRRNIEVTIQSRLEINFQLEVGAVDQTIQVESIAPILETQSSSIQQLVEARTINNLPLNGRNASFLAQISPGVTFAQNDGRGLQASGSFTANGMERTQNNYLLDGMDNNVAIGDLVNQAQYVVMPPPDALKEFTVQTSNYSAEFGHSAGAVLNVSTKSGTNSFHGNAWWYVRNDMFDSRDYFAKAVLNGVAQAKAKYRQNQFGGTFLGPIWRDHTFFMVDYQGTRIVQGQNFTVTVPTLAERNSGYTNLNDLIVQQANSPTRTDQLGRRFPLGTVFDPATTRSTRAGTIDPVTGIVATTTGAVRDPFYTGSIVGKTDYTDGASRALLNQIPAGRMYAKAVDLLNLYPEPNTNGSALTANFSDNPNVTNNTNSFDVRVDHTFSQKDSAFIRYSYAHNNQSNPGPFTGIADGAASRPGTGYTEAQNGALSWTHIISAHLVNEARVGYSRVFDKRLQFGADQMGIPDQYGIPGVPQLSENGGLPLLQFSQLHNLGAAGTNPSDKASDVWQATENLSIDRSKHQIRTGFEFQNIAFPMATPSQPRGDFTHSGIYTSIVNNTDGSTDRAQFVLEPITNTLPTNAAYTKYDYVGGANSIAATSFPPVYHPVRRYYGAYVQDSWRVTNSFTINAGFRYEFIGVPAESDGRIGNFQSAYTGDTPDGISRYFVPQRQLALLNSYPAVVNVLTANGIVITPVHDTAIGLAQKTNFAPRFGFALQPASKVSVRGGYGLFYQPNESHGLSISPYVNFPFQVTNNLSGGSAFQSIATATGDTAGPISKGLVNISTDPSIVKGTSIAFQGEPRHPKTTYSQAYTLQVQYQPFANTMFFIGYVGSNARHVQLSMGTNTTNVISAPTVNINTISFFHAPGNVMATGGSYISRKGFSDYNSLQFGAERRFHNGLAFTANMTYGKCMGNVRDLLDNGIGGLRAPYVPGMGPGADYGLCDIDVKRIIHTAGTYELPFGPGKSMLQSGPGAWVAGGWSMNWIFTAQDGQPQTIGCTTTNATGLGCNALKNNADPYVHGNNLDRVSHFYNAAAFYNPPAATALSAGPANLGGAPTQVRGPEYSRLDFSVFRKFPFIHESYFQFRAEAFNLLNTPTFGQPGSLNFTNTSAFSQITSTRNNDDSRELQFSMKYYF